VGSSRILRGNRLNSSRLMTNDDAHMFRGHCLSPKETACMGACGPDHVGYCSRALLCSGEHGKLEFTLSWVTCLSVLWRCPSAATSVEGPALGMCLFRNSFFAAFM
jgi:hypothetical protein